MKRGLIVLAAAQGEYTRKPRPFLVVQSDLFNSAHGSISLCPVTSRIGGGSLFRISLEADPATGLRENSEIQIDKVQSLRRGRIVRLIGVAPAAAIVQVDQALRRWLAL